MTELTLEEKTNYAKMRAAEETAEKYFFDANQPFFPLGFSIGYRNPGHWDIIAKECPGRASAWLHAHPGGFTSAQDGGNSRAFRIRGEPGKVVVYDERWDPHRKDRPALHFKSVTGAMFYIIEELMQEPSK